MGKGVVAVVIGPWYVGSYLAVQFGAANPSPARTMTGWVFEAAWLAFLAFMALYLLVVRSGARKLGLARAVKERRIAAKARAVAPQKLSSGKSTKLRCHNCQHVQTVPLSQQTFECEQCGTKLQRRTGPANGS
jgi:ribosomal protein S27E